MKVPIFLLLPVVALLAGRTAGGVTGPIETLWKEQVESAAKDGADMPDLMAFGRMISSVMHSWMEKHESTMNERLMRLETIMQESCRGGATRERGVKAGDVEAKLSKRLDGFAGQMSALMQSFADNLRQEFTVNIQYFMKRTEDKLSTLSTKSDLLHYETRQAHLAREKTSTRERESATAVEVALEKKLSTFASRDDLAKQAWHLDNRLQYLQDLVSNASLAEILNHTRRTLHTVSTLAPMYESLAKVASTCESPSKSGDRRLEHMEDLLENVAQDVEDNSGILRGVSEALEDAEDMLEGRLLTLERLVVGRSDESTTVAASPSPEPTAGVPGPCVDSEFVREGFAPMDVCISAVRHEKCRLPIVAYHCCRSCVDAGLIPEEGPHRYLHYPRRVNMFLKF